LFEAADGLCHLNINHPCKDSDEHTATRLDVMPDENPADPSYGEQRGAQDASLTDQSNGMLKK